MCLMLPRKGPVQCGGGGGLVYIVASKRSWFNLEKGMGAFGSVKRVSGVTWSK